MASLHPLPHDAASLQAALARSRRLLHHRALVAGAAGAVPLPGLDWAVSAAVLTRVLPRMRAEFGLSPRQIAALPPEQRARVDTAVASVGAVLIGRFVTQDLLLRMARRVGTRLGSQQLAKFIPLAGPLISGALAYSLLRLLGEQHLRDCVRVVQLLQPGTAAHAQAPTDAAVPAKPPASV